MTNQHSIEQDENTTRDGIVVRPGQVWEDCDKRQSGRRVIVRFVAGGKAVVEPVAGLRRRSVLSVARMHPTSTGFKLVQEVIR